MPRNPKTPEEIAVALRKLEVISELFLATGDDIPVVIVGAGVAMDWACGGGMSETFDTMLDSIATIIAEIVTDDSPKVRQLLDDLLGVLPKETTH